MGNVVIVFAKRGRKSNSTLIILKVQQFAVHSITIGKPKPNQFKPTAVLNVLQTFIIVNLATSVSVLAPYVETRTQKHLQ